MKLFELKILIREEISTIRRDKGKEIFNYSSIINNAWFDIIREGQKFYNINFDLENNDSTGQKKTFYITKNLRKNQPVKYQINADLWMAHGDWEYPVMYFKIELTDDYGLVSDKYRVKPKYIWDTERDYSGLYKNYVIIPPIDSGNKLVKIDKGWRAYTDEDISHKDRKKVEVTDNDKTIAWKWLEEFMNKAVEERHEMLDSVNKEIVVKEIIRKEARKLFEAPNISTATTSVGLPTPSPVNKVDGKIHHAPDAPEYAVEYFDDKMGAKQLGSYKSASMAKQNALDFYKSQKISRHLGRETDYIGVSSDTGDEFWIFYVNQSYLDGMNKNLFKDKRAYRNWMTAAYDVMRSGEPQGGHYSLKEIVMDFPSGLANSSGITNIKDLIRAKSDFTDRNFPPDVRLTKKGPFYVFHGETYNLRDIFNLMKHHTLIPFELKIIDDKEYWVTKSKESAQKAIFLINKRYPKSKDIVKINR